MPDGSTPAETSASLAARTRSSTAAKTFFDWMSLDMRRILRAGMRRGLAQIGGRVKEPRVLDERVTVRHAGDEVGDETRLRGFIVVTQSVQPFRRQRRRLAREMREQVAHHAFGIGHD